MPAAHPRPRFLDVGDQALTVEVGDRIDEATNDLVLSLDRQLRDARARFEREFISSTLQRHHGRVGDAAKALGIQRTNLYRKVRQLGVPRTLLSSHK